MPITHPAPGTTPITIAGDYADPHTIPTLAEVVASGAVMPTAPGTITTQSGGGATGSYLSLQPGNIDGGAAAIYAGTGSTGPSGARVDLFGGGGDFEFGGTFQASGGHGEASHDGGGMVLTGGTGNGGSTVGGGFLAAGGGSSSGAHGHATFVTGNFYIDLKAGTADPTSGAGVNAYVGSFYVETDGSTIAALWFKNGASDTAWTLIS